MPDGASGGSRGRAAQGLPEPRDPLEDVFESGGELFLAIGYTPGGAPFGPRVEIADGELRRIATAHSEP